MSTQTAPPTAAEPSETGWWRRNRWALAALPVALALALVAAGDRVRTLWWEQDLRVPTTVEPGATARLPPACARPVSAAPCRSTCRCASTTSATRRPCPTDLELPAGTRAVQVDLTLSADPDVVLTGCSLAVRDAAGTRYDYVSSGWGALQPVVPCVPEDTPGPWPSLGDLDDVLTDPDAPPRPATWSVSPVVVVPEGVEVTDVVLWWQKPQYAAPRGAELDRSVTGHRLRCRDRGLAREDPVHAGREQRHRHRQADGGRDGRDHRSEREPGVDVLRPARRPGTSSWIASSIRVATRNASANTSIGPSPATASRRSPSVSAVKRPRTSPTTGAAASVVQRRTGAGHPLPRRRAQARLTLRRRCELVPVDDRPDGEPREGDDDEVVEVAQHAGDRVDDRVDRAGQRSERVEQREPPVEDDRHGTPALDPRPDLVEELRRERRHGEQPEGLDVGAGERERAPVAAPLPAAQQPAEHDRHHDEGDEGPAGGEVDERPVGTVPGRARTRSP